MKGKLTCEGMEVAAIAQLWRQKEEYASCAAASLAQYERALAGLAKTEEDLAAWTAPVGMPEGIARARARGAFHRARVDDLLKAVDRELAKCKEAVEAENDALAELLGRRT